MKIKFFISVLALCAVAIGHAQVKIGYTNAEYILGLLPEAKQIEADLTAYEKQLQNQLQEVSDRFLQRGSVSRGFCD